MGSEAKISLAPISITSVLIWAIFISSLTWATSIFIFSNFSLALLAICDNSSEVAPLSFASLSCVVINFLSDSANWPSSSAFFSAW